MNKSSYVPRSDSDRVIWLNNFSTKISTYATNLGVSAAEVTAVHNDNAMFSYIVNTIEVYKQTTANLYSYKTLLKHATGQQHLPAIPALPALGTAPGTVTEGVFDRVSKLVQRIKASTNYTEGIGTDLGIIATTSTLKLDELQPDIKIKLDAGRPHLRWTKGDTDGLELSVDRNDGAGFVLLGRLMRNEFLDVASLAANKLVDEWNYKGIYIISDTPVGLYSPPISIMVKKV